MLLPTLLFAAISNAATAAEATLAERVAMHYVELARARYADAFAGAEALHASVRALLAEPTPATHAAAKDAWVRAHAVYSHCEVFRFGNPNVDAWEGRVNAWPMDEGLIDYVASGYVYHEGNPHALDDIIGLGRLPINDEIIAAYQEGQDPKAQPNATTSISDIETNVTRGYHAIEFLLWGQDLDRSSAESGQRPYTDYVLGEGCTGGKCARRRDYISAASRLLLSDLRFMIYDWDPAQGVYGKTFTALPLEEQLDRMVVGMGTMAYGELASERMQVALISSDQEEEQNCFSDTTHLAILHNARGIETLYFGTHTRVDGTKLEGPSLSDLVRSLDPELDQRVRDELARTAELTAGLVAAADAGEPFDRMILAENEAGRARVRALIGQLQRETEALEAVRAEIKRLAQQ